MLPQISPANPGGSVPTHPQKADFAQEQRHPETLRNIFNFHLEGSRVPGTSSDVQFQPLPGQSASIVAVIHCLPWCHWTAAKGKGSSMAILSCMVTVCLSCLAMFANTDAMVQATIVICYQVAMVGAGRGKVIDEGTGENLRQVFSAGTVRHEPGKNYHFPSISTTTILQAWGQKCQVMAGVNNPSSAFTIVAFGVASSEDRPSWSGPQDPSGSSSIWKEFNVAMFQWFANVRNSDTSQPLEAEKKHSAQLLRFPHALPPNPPNPNWLPPVWKKTWDMCLCGS